MCPQAQERQGWLAAPRSGESSKHGMDSPREPLERTNLQTPRLWTSGFQNWEGIHHPECGPLLRQPQEVHTVTAAHKLWDLLTQSSTSPSVQTQTAIPCPPSESQPKDVCKALKQASVVISTHAKH